MLLTHLPASLRPAWGAVPVMETFLGGAYKADINTDNPLGQGGKLANSFGSLMEKLWHVSRGSAGAAQGRGGH